MTEALTLEIAARAVGAALLHSIWQGAAAAALAAAGLRLLRGAPAQLRYAVACVALAGVLGAWTVTAARSAAGAMASVPAPSATVVQAPPLLGAGPFDFSSAIQLLSAPDGRAAGRWPSPWARLDAWSRAAVPLWFAGVLLLSVRLGVGWAMVARLRRVALCPASSELAARVVHLARPSASPALSKWRSRLRFAFRPWPVGCGRSFCCPRTCCRRSPRRSFSIIRPAGGCRTASAPNASTAATMWRCRCAAIV